LAALASADDRRSDHAGRERKARPKAKVEASSRVSAAALRLTFFPSIADDVEIVRQALNMK